MEAKKTLIVIDMQNDFIDQALGTKEAVAIIPRALEKIKEYEKRGDKIIFTLDTHTESYLDTPEGKKLPVKHCIKGQEGWKIREELDIIDADHIEKGTFGFADWNKLYKFGADDEIELIGLCTDICVVSNALILKAQFPEAKISVDAKACAGVSKELHEAALATMKSCQIDVIE